MFILYVLCCENSIVINFVICVTSIVPITTFFTLLFIPLGSAPLPECTRATFKTPFLHCHVLTLSLFETGLEKGGQSGAIGAPVRLIDYKVESSWAPHQKSLSLFRA